MSNVFTILSADTLPLAAKILRARLVRFSWILLVFGLLLCLVSAPTEAAKKTHKNKHYKKNKTAFIYPFVRNEVSLGLYNRHVFTANLPHPPSPIFWSASTKVDSGFILMYKHLIFHTRKYFSIYVGASTARWVRRDQSIYTLSGFIAFRLWLFRTAYFNPYLIYSVAGPTIISRTHLGNANLGKHFLWQDYLGIGTQIGKKHNFNVSLVIIHYSNGDFFVHNPGFGVPIVVFIGYSF